MSRKPWSTSPTRCSSPTTHLVERELDRVARTAAELLEVLRRGEALRAVLDDEGGDALLLRDVRVRAREHDAEAADAALRDEHLRAVDDPLVGARSRRAVVRRPAESLPLPGSVSAHAASHSPRGRLREVLLLDGLAAERQDVPRAEPVVRGHGERERAVDPRDLLDADRVARHVHAGAAVLLGDADPEETELRELRHDLLREALFLVPLLGVREDLRAREIADGLAEELVVLGQGEVHDHDHLGGPTPRRQWSSSACRGASGNGDARARARAARDGLAMVVRGAPIARSAGARAVLSVGDR